MRIQKKMHYFTALTVILLGLTSKAQTDSSTYSDDTRSTRISKGGFYIEPLISVIRDDSTIKTSQLPLINKDTSGTSEGYGFGFKLGGHISEIALLGVDARYSREKMNDSFYNSADAESYNWGPTVSLQTPLYGIRVMGTYVAGGEYNPTAGVQGLDLKFKEARGTRVGLGAHVASVSVSLEYQDLTYDTTDVESIGSLVVDGTTKVDTTTRGYGVNLSFPIEL